PSVSPCSRQIFRMLLVQNFPPCVSQFATAPRIEPCPAGWPVSANGREFAPGTPSRDANAPVRRCQDVGGLLRDFPSIKCGQPSLGKFFAPWEYAGAYDKLSYSLAVR